MTVSIPILGIPSQRFSVTLDGIVYQLIVRWNSRNGFWSMDWFDAENVAILSGMRIVPHYDSLSSFVLAALPPGKLYAVDPTGENSEIPETWDPFELLYVEAG